MRIQHSYAKANRDDQVPPIRPGRTLCDPSDDTAAALATARDRLTMTAKQCQQRKALSNGGPYYGEKGQLEELVREIARSDGVDALVTRNNYGCLVLNAARALFIDVDMPEPSPATGRINECGDRLEGLWRRSFDDLRTVLASEGEEGFRIYRTAAGFRVLATTHEFDPGSPQSYRLMNAVGADADFVRLCGIQNSFRARLTPKPWRCGMPQPPSSFPRRLPDDQRRFAAWLAQYERASRDRATCQYLEDIGPSDRHPRLAPIVEFHDRESRAFEPLYLA